MLPKYEWMRIKLEAWKQIQWVYVDTDLKLSKTDCHSVTPQTATPLLD